MNKDRSTPESTKASFARWSVAGIIAFAALIGAAALTAMFLIAFNLPTWLQYGLGIGLPVGAAVLAWLIASALTSASRNRP